ncbi:MAG: hypothetical protein HYS18_05730 [Burkholderiales bacterium]|nr:hypothetical protein [Burkholderiales bacterium]
MTSLENLTAYSTNSSARQDHKTGPAQHGAWMLELEKAMLALTTPHNNSQSASRQNEVERDAGEAEKDANKMTQTVNDTVMTAQDFAGDDSVKLDNIPNRIQGNDAAGFNAATGETEQTPGDKKSAVGGVVVGQFNTLDSSIFQSNPLPVGEGLVSLLPAGIFNEQRARFDIAAINSDHALVVNAALDPANSSNTSLLNAFRASGAHVDSFMTDHLGDEAMEQSGANSNAEAAQENEEYAKRQIHLYKADDGLHAWVRDAELTSAQGSMVAQALDSEFVATGVRLVSVTVNGVKVQDRLNEQEDGGNTDIFIEAGSQGSTAGLHNADIVEQGIYGKGEI